MNFLNSLPLSDKQKKKVDQLGKLAKLTGLDKPINDKLKVKPDQHAAGHAPPAHQQAPTGYPPHAGTQYPASGSQPAGAVPTGHHAAGASGFDKLVGALPLTDKQKKKVDQLGKLAKLTGLDKPINDKLKVKPDQHPAGHQGYAPPAYGQQAPTGYPQHAGPQPGASPYGIPPYGQQPHGPTDYTHQPYQQPYPTSAPPTGYPSSTAPPQYPHHP